MGLALGTNLTFYTSLSKGLKLKVRKFLGLISTFVEVTGEKLVGGFFGPPPILNRVNNDLHNINVWHYQWILNLILVSNHRMSYLAAK